MSEEPGTIVTYLEDLKWEAVAGRAARARLAGSPGEPPRDDGRSAPRGTLRPDVGRRAHANGARAAERAGFRQEECGDISPRRRRRPECLRPPANRRKKHGKSEV